MSSVEQHNERSAQIANIIVQRQPLVNKLEKVIVHLKELEQALRALQANQKKQREQWSDEPKIVEKLEEINVAPVQQKIRDYFDVLHKLKARFSRQTINIGVVGLARQGKSTLLQVLSGLTDAEIPSSDRMPCTSVQSTIYHQSEGGTYAKVYFHSESSFLCEVIAPYYEKLGLGAPPTTLDEFRHQDLPPLPTNRKNPATAESVYQHLRDDYYSCLDKYADLLKPEQRQEIVKKEQIKEFISQEYDVQGNPLFFKHLAVREVEIFCSFKAVGVEKIGLVNMPGLGDTRLGDEERMIKALGEDVDFIVFVRKPVAKGDFWKKEDIALYDSAYQALEDKLPLDLWSFMVLNQDDDNLERCQDLKNTLVKEPIRVLECIITNCKNPQQANELLFKIIIHLATEITNLDKRYADSCQKGLQEIHNAVNAELKKAENIFDIPLPQEFNFFAKSEEVWENIANGLEEYLKKLGEKRDVEDTEFKKQIEAAIQKCKEDTGIPSTEEIERRNNTEKGYNIVYEKSLNQIRANLSQHFLSLDDGLKPTMEKVKSDVANILIEQGGLGGLTDGRGVDFLREMVEKIPDEVIKGKPSKLKLGLQLLVGFELSYRGFIQHRIRKHLDILTPNNVQVIDIGSAPKSQTIYNSLTEAHEEAVYNCEAALKNFLKEPNEACFAILEEFLDRILRAADVKIEWQTFLDKEKGKIWRVEIEGDAAELFKREEWMKAVNRVTDAMLISYNYCNF